MKCCEGHGHEGEKIIKPMMIYISKEELGFLLDLRQRFDV